MVDSIDLDLELNNPEWKLFVREKYYEHIDETLALSKGTIFLSMKQYYDANKWYLKKLYKDMYINS